MSSSIPSFAKKHVIFSLAVLDFLLLLLLGIPGYIITSHSYASQTVFVVHKDKPLTLTTAQGTNVMLGFQIDGSLNNYWASPNGLTLTLDGVNQPLTVVEPKERNWDDSIHTTASDPGNSLDVVGTLTIPAFISDSQQHTLKGTLSGSIVYPTPGRDPNSSDSSGPLFAFHNETVNVNTPIQIQLESQGSFLWSSGYLPFEIFYWADIVLCVGLVLLTIVALIRAITARSRAGTQRPTAGATSRMKETIQMVLGAIVISAICFFILFLILESLGEKSDLLHPIPEAISTGNLLLPLLITIACGVGLVAVLAQPDEKVKPS
ncbi:hypothetical protein [Ktedonobacter racemifer]|uniref:Uncharacterized protein n=1 Tax=Ktedonobacter racemifer DSM 44963 TaxID=485913 RepID=D6TFZ4_KTERA|nr:hypothetical protein [Ktedonobacter racemifer]EFH90627.1 hypothetical protein Krac_12254 [Ktedonobacter racemifer DSM 44963]